MGNQYTNLFAPVRGPGNAVQSQAGMPIVWFDDFIGAYMAVDLALASESDPTGHFSETADRGIYLISFDTLVAATQLPAPQDTADGGWVKCTTDATSGERITFQLNGTMFPMVLGRRLLFETRLKVSATTADAFFGLGVANATDPHASRPAGFVAFTLTGDADLEVATGNASTATASTDTGTDIVADTFMVLTIEWDGQKNVKFMKDGVVVYTVSVSASGLGSTLPTDLTMAPILCIESNGAAEALTVDYLLVVCDRASS